RLDDTTTPSRPAETESFQPRPLGTDAPPPRLADTSTDAPPLRPGDTDTTTPHLADTDTVTRDSAPLPPGDGTRLGHGGSGGPLGDAVLDDMLRAPRRNDGTTAGTSVPGAGHPVAGPDLLDRAVFRRSTWRTN